LLKDSKFKTIFSRAVALFNLKGNIFKSKKFLGGGTTAGQLGSWTARNCDNCWTAWQLGGWAAKRLDS
jgi:hypothetical protein